MEAVGHTSMLLSNGTYISWWPVGGAKAVVINTLFKTGKLATGAKAVRTLQDDIKLENERPNGYELSRSEIDEGAIQRWWEKFQKENHKWHLTNLNCSTVVYRALCAGNPQSNEVDDGSIIWTPWGIESFIKVNIDEGELLGLLAQELQEWRLLERLEREERELRERLVWLGGQKLEREREEREFGKRRGLGWLEREGWELRKRLERLEWEQLERLERRERELREWLLERDLQDLRELREWLERKRERLERELRERRERLGRELREWLERERLVRLDREMREWLELERLVRQERPGRLERLGQREQLGRELLELREWLDRERPGWELREWREREEREKLEWRERDERERRERWEGERRGWLWWKFRERLGRMLR